MNKIQKIALIVFVSSFFFWLMFPTQYGDYYYEFFDRPHQWFMETPSFLSFSLIIASSLTLFLFRDSKKEDE